MVVVMVVVVQQKMKAFCLIDFTLYSQRG